MYRAVNRLSSMPLADLAIVLSIFQLVHLIPSALVMTAVRHQSGSFQNGAILGLTTWIVPVALLIWKLGASGKASIPNTELRVFHTLPAVFLGFLLIRGGVDWNVIDYLFGFVDFVLLIALFLYGFLCLSFRVRPPWAYLFYLAGSITSFLRMLSRL